MAGDDFQRPEVDELVEINRPAKGIDFFVPSTSNASTTRRIDFIFLPAPSFTSNVLWKPSRKSLIIPSYRSPLSSLNTRLRNGFTHRLHVRVHAEVLPVHEYSREVAARCRQARLAKQLVRQVLLHQRRILNVVVQRQPVEAKVAPSFLAKLNLILSDGRWVELEPIRPFFRRPTGPIDLPLIDTSAGRYV